jgi:hypothetical protein
VKLIKGERKAYILLVSLSVVTAILSVLVSISQIKANNQKFCELVVISNEHPLPVSDTSFDPIKERARAMFDEYNRFGRALGCPNSEKP